MAYATWPNDPLPIGVELTLSTGQHDITDDVDRAGLSITRGRSDESGTVGPGSLKFKVRNPTGTYSPRNPASSLFGEIGRNTPCLAYVDLGAPRLVLPGAGSASTPDHASLDITGDIDLRVDLRPGSWRPSATCWVGVLKLGAYGLYITTDGYLHLLWNDSGAVQHDVASTIPVPGGTTGRKAIRATLDVNNGVGGHVVAFYLWSGGAWVAFGDSVVRALPTSIINSTGALQTAITAELGTTSIYEVQVRSGIGGSLVANPIFTSQTSGATSFVDSPGRTWTVSSSAALWNRHYRVNAEVAEWPSRWSEKGSTESFVEVAASGVLRRLSQGQSVVRSVLYRECSTLPDLVAYWPCEDADGSTTVAGYGSSRPGNVTGGVEFAAYDGLVASEPLPKLNTGRLTFRPPGGPITGEVQFRFILNMPTAPANGTILARFHTTSTLGWLDLIYGTGDSLTLTAYTNQNVSLGSVGPLALSSVLRTGPQRLSIELTQSGGTVSMTLAGLSVGQPTGWYATAASGTCTLGAPSTIVFNPNSADLGDTTVGHVTAEDNVTSLFSVPTRALVGYTGESAVDRIARLADENGLDLELIGAGGESGRCGPQKVATLLELLRDAEEADGGVLYEPDTGHTLAYRSLDSITRQTAVALDYVENQFRPFEPTDDDQATRNDVTVKRDGGTEYRAVDTDGPLGVDSIGRYDTSVTLPLAYDDDAQHAAGWRLNLGTVDDSRWPEVGFNLADPRILADPLLVLALLELDIGDRLTISDLPEWLPPFPADVIVQGISETMSPRSWQITLNTSPAAPFDVVAFDWDARLDNDTTVVQSAINSTTTTMPVLFYTGPRWTAADGSFDVLVGGEVMTVTGVSGAGPTQLFTVVRSVNNVVKSHSVGAKISLYEPRRWAT